jgi:phosphoribosyl-ATP pyrophosphohydrolase
MKSAVDPAVIATIWSVILERAKTPSRESYTSRLLSDDKGIDKVLEKVGEESTEFIIAAKNGVNERTIQEACDLISPSRCVACSRHRPVRCDAGT